MLGFDGYTVSEAIQINTQIRRYRATFYLQKPMQIDIQTKNFTLLEIQGNVIGQDALVLKTVLEEHIQELGKQGVTPMLVFNMERTQTVDSAGLGVLITTSTQVRQMGGRVVLLNLNRSIRRMLIRTNLTSLFDFPKNLEEAITNTL